MITFPLDALDVRDPAAGLKRAKRIASHISFFKAGVCLGKTLVCVVKASPLSSTIKTLEPIDQNVRGRAKPTFRKLLQGGNDTLKVFKVSPVPHNLPFRAEYSVLETSGILHSRPIKFNTFPEDKTLCWMHERIRDRRFGNT